MGLGVSVPRSGGDTDQLVPKKVERKLRDFEEHPVSRVVLQDGLDKELVSASKEHLKQLREIAANIDDLPAVHLPQGYRPEAERFPTEGGVVEVKTGLLSASVSVSVTYAPPKLGILWGSAPAKLRGVLTVGENCFPIAPVNISEKGQCNLATEEWSHERVCEEVSQYLHLLCREAEKLSRKSQANATFVDFDPDFEAHLVRMVAHATNLLQLPEYYRAYADREGAHRLTGELTEQVQTLGDEIKAHFQKLNDRISELDASLVGKEAVGDLTKRVKERASFIYEEALRSIEGKAVADLVKQRDALEDQISFLEETLDVTEQETQAEIKKLQKRVDRAKTDLGIPEIRSQILSDIRQSGFNQKQSLTLLKELAPLCDPSDKKIVLDQVNYFRFLKLILSDYCRSIDVSTWKGARLEGEIEDCVKLMRYLSFNLSPLHADLIYKNLQKMAGEEASPKLRCVKALLEH